MKKPLLIFLIVLTFALPLQQVFAAIAFVQAKNGSVNSVTSTDVSISPTVGNFLVAEMTLGANTTCTISDNLGDTWTVGITARETYEGYKICAFYLENIPSGITTVTFTGPPNSNIRAVVEEFSGVATSASTDAAATKSEPSGGNFSSPSPWSLPNHTTTNANDLLINMTGDSQATGWNQGTNWTLNNNASTTGGSVGNGNIVMQYRIVSSTGTYNGAGSAKPGGNDGIVNIVYSFKQAAAAAVATVSPHKFLFFSNFQFIFNLGQFIFR